MSSDAQRDLGVGVDPAAGLLTDRVVVITGAARGIGRSTALTAARYGARLALVDKLGDELSVVASECEALGAHGTQGVRCVSVVGDVRHDAVVEATMQAAIDAFGRIDVLVNNAGGGFWAPLLDVSAKGQTALMAENFGQVVACIRAAVPHMIGGGSIVNVTSIEGHRAGPGFAIYSSMKAAVENLSKSMALELADRRIRVNCVAPDMIPTPGDAGLVEASAALADNDWPGQPWPDDGTPEDCAAAVVFLAGDLARFITGTTIHVDGGTFAASGWRRGTAPGTWRL